MSPIQKKIYNYLSECAEKPTIRKIGQDLGISSPSLVISHIRKLEKMGYIKYHPKEVGIQPIVTYSFKKVITKDYYQILKELPEDEEIKC